MSIPTIARGWCRRAWPWVLGVAMMPAYADDARDTPDRLDTPNAKIDAEAGETRPRAGRDRSREASPGGLADSHLRLTLRSYADALDARDGPHRHAWVQAAIADFTSGYTPGPVGFGVDASVFAALKLDGGAGAGNMVDVARDGGGSNALAWAYAGGYAAKARFSGTVLRYGLQRVDNPFMTPHDNRALPPAFLGATLVSEPLRSLTLEAGSFTKNVARGRTTLSALASQYGDTRIDRVSYGGGRWRYAPGGEASLYLSRAERVWNQAYASVRQRVGATETLRWTGFGNVYVTHDTGAARQGRIDNVAYSLSLAAEHGPHEMLLGFQQVLGDQFFDYVAETNGIFLVNSMDVDYNAPHETSLQLRYTFDGDAIGWPGSSVMVWGLTGWGADASALAALDATRRSLAWKNGAPVQGRHHEIGIVPTLVLRGGRFKGTTISLIAMRHIGSAHYADSNNQECRLVVNVF